MEQKNRYQLRHAAGLYWLLDMDQPGIPYRKPVPVNEVAAAIWKMIEAGKTQSEIENEIGRIYGISGEEVHSDVQEFLDQLRSLKIINGDSIG